MPDQVVPHNKHNHVQHDDLPLLQGEHRQPEANVDKRGSDVIQRVPLQERDDQRTHGIVQIEEQRGGEVHLQENHRRWHLPRERGCGDPGGGQNLRGECRLWRRRAMLEGRRSHRRLQGPVQYVAIRPEQVAHVR